MKLSLLVVTFDRPADLLDLLDSVAQQEGLDDVLDEVLILDNGSTADYSAPWAFVERHPELRINIRRSEVNAGYPAGRNSLIEAARGEGLLIVDDDIVFSTPRDVMLLARSLEADDFASVQVGIVQPRVVYFDTNEVQGTAFPHKRLPPDAETGPFLTSFFVGAAHLVKKQALQKTGLYPVDFFYGMEEYDLSYRMIDAGFAIGYDPTVTVRHKESPRGRLANHAKVRRQWVNKSVVAWRYLPRRYFVTTALMWSLEYVRRVRGHPWNYLLAWRDVLRIPFVVRRKPIGTEALAYLQMVDARLWY